MESNRQYIERQAVKECINKAKVILCNVMKSRLDIHNPSGYYKANAIIQEFSTEMDKWERGKYEAKNL